jgi:hypothetical protein
MCLFSPHYQSAVLTFAGILALALLQTALVSMPAFLFFAKVLKLSFFLILVKKIFSSAV